MTALDRLVGAGIAQSTLFAGLAALLAALLAVGAGGILVHRTLAPLDLVRDSLESIADDSGDLSRALPGEGSDEVGAVALAFNRFARRLAAGIVDTDEYNALINFPFFATAPDGFYTLAKGTPLVHVIPFRRTDLQLAGEVRAETAEEAAQRQRILRATSAGEGWYRTEARDKR